MTFDGNLGRLQDSEEPGICVLLDCLVVLRMIQFVLYSFCSFRNKCNPYSQTLVETFGSLPKKHRNPLKFWKPFPVEHVDLQVSKEDDAK